MEIYKYNPQTKEWRDILNSSLKGKKREDAFDEYIKKFGEKVSIQDYFNDDNRNDWSTDYSYKFFGNAENCIERLVKGEIDWDEDLCYCLRLERSPEDLIECRTDWNEMKSYANGLVYFINSLKREIASGKLTINTISE